MRWLIVLAVIACSDKKPKKHFDDAAVRIDAARVTGDDDRDKLFLSVPSSKAVAGVIERLAEKPHVAGTPANEAVAKEIMRTLGRMGWQLGTQQYDVYLPHPKKLAVAADGVAISVGEAGSTDDPLTLGWNAYSANGKVTGPLATELAKAKGAVLLQRYGALYRGAQVAAAQRAGAIAVIFYVDPSDDPERAKDTLQRGTVAFYWQYPGDPLTPGAPAKPGTPRRQPAGAEVLPRLPVVTVTATEAEKLRGAKSVTVEVELDGETRPIRNIVAILAGKSKDAVILGNHYDAWGPGALDPHSGTATMIEIARGLTALVQAGWQPRRTIVLAFWDAEEFGMLGSTEWVEDQADMLAANAVAYFNVDTIKAGSLVVKGSPALYAHVRTCAAQVTDPSTGKPFAPTFDDLGIGSDYTAFLHHAGIASLQWQTGEGSGKYTVWHSLQDDVEHAKAQSDPGFSFIPAFARVMGLCAIQLADTKYLPLHYGEMVEWIAKRLPAGVAVDTDKLAAAALAADSMAIKAGGDPAKCNAALVVAERGFLAPDGIAGRPWYRHLAIGPDPANGYAALPLPELATTDPKARERARERLAAAIDRVATALAPCRSLSP